MPGNFAGLVTGDATPSVTDRDKLWFRSKSNCEPMGFFAYYNGSWKRAITHPLLPGMIIDYYSTSLPSASDHAVNSAYISFLDSYDETYPGGGSTTLATNPWWRVCDGTGGTPDLRGRVSVGAGLGSSLSDRLYGQTTGEESHVLSLAELPNFSLPSGAVTGSGTGFASASVTGTPLVVITGGGAAHNTMQPSFVVYKIIRTSRIV
jgi:microcystin-dependent protein